jgi:hypothetical protein
MIRLDTDIEVEWTDAVKALEYDRWRSGDAAFRIYEHLDQANLDSVWIADYIAEHYHRLPTYTPALKMTDAQLAATIPVLRNAVKLPIADMLIDLLAVLLADAEGEARRRLEIARKRSQRPATDWQNADLITEIAAVAGEGRQRGSDVWFHCPFGHSSGRTASLHVDAGRRLWHCFGCQRGGGVVAWRRAVEGRAA